MVRNWVMCQKSGHSAGSGPNLGQRLSQIWADTWLCSGLLSHKLGLLSHCLVWNLVTYAQIQKRKWNLVGFILLTILNIPDRAHYCYSLAESSCAKESNAPKLVLRSVPSSQPFGAFVRSTNTSPPTIIIQTIPIMQWFSILPDNLSIVEGWIKSFFVSTTMSLSLHHG